ncbi:MAG: lamin tail domain-containing protein [Candidatus Zixiibacteriota bacterium]
MKRYLIFFISLSLTYNSVKAELIVNEVLANEPGGKTSLEWIELYNDSSYSIKLSDYQLKIGDNIINLPMNVNLGVNEYFIICRRLFASVTSPGFESFWGDSSGFWGNTPFEQSLKTPYEVSFSLINDSGAVSLMINGIEVSSFTWFESGRDSFSWERILTDEDTVGQSVDNNGSTPGFINSLTPLPFDLSLENVKVAHSDGYTNITFQIVNRGINNVSEALLYIMNDAKDVSSDTIDIISIPSLSSGQVIDAEQQYIFDGIYVPLTAVLTDDDRNNNNTISFTATGSSFPPLIISELMANPENGLGTEWLEIKNRSEQAVDLFDWQFGDANRIYSISSESFIIEPGEYLVLVQSADNFMNFYQDNALKIIQPSQWTVFNNNGDMVRLLDSYGIEADRYEFTEVFNDNYTWSRGEELSNENLWGRSENVKGTPGEINRVLFEQTASDLSVTVEPVHISPNGDGYEDYTTISITAPQADEYTIKIYDRQGRVVKTFYNKETYISNQFQWDGMTDFGNRLPIGIYILLIEAHGEATEKKPIVIAR